ncbi:hypothetical protein D6833_07190 [Candidatus Parcubacteria bacterium]|nr:MAG: hypothetical protein D6833_07190 [Candidatus Parcubacteria bacterium]
MQHSIIYEMSDLIATRLGLDGGAATQIKSALNEYWRNFAVKVMDIDDVRYRAARMGYPMSDDAAAQILQIVEDKASKVADVSMENLLDEFLDNWVVNMDWSGLSSAQMKQYFGDFVVGVRRNDGIDGTRLPADSSLLDAVQQAKQRAQREHTPVCVISGEPEDRFEQIAIYGNCLLIVTPDGELQPGTD